MGLWPNDPLTKAKQGRFVLVFNITAVSVNKTNAPFCKRPGYFFPRPVLSCVERIVNINTTPADFQTGSSETLTIKI